MVGVDRSKWCWFVQRAYAHRSWNLSSSRRVQETIQSIFKRTHYYKYYYVLFVSCISFPWCAIRQVKRCLLSQSVWIYVSKTKKANGIRVAEGTWKGATVASRRVRSSKKQIQLSWAKKNRISRIWIMRKWSARIRIQSQSASLNVALCMKVWKGMCRKCG